MLIMPQRHRVAWKRVPSESSTTQVMWTAAMREETLEALSAARMAPADMAQGPASLAQFRHVALAEELVVAGVFVRLYNEQPDCPLADAPALCKGLVTHVHMATAGDAMRTTAAAAGGAFFPSLALVVAGVA